MKERKRVPFRLHEGSCIDSLKLYPDNHFDSCVTDPPYELGFMGRAWDSSGIAFQKSTWEAVLRVMKPGAYLLAFGGTRTWHRLVCAIEDAGFEVRDCVMWLYGAGFPKSLNASKAIDEHLGFEREVTREATAPAIRGGVYGGDMSSSEDRERRDKPVSLQAVQWDGWGTALKPAWEPIVVARRPLVGTVAMNVLAFGTGAINIDACRVPGWNSADLANMAVSSSGAKAQGAVPFLKGSQAASSDPLAADLLGRWPANVIHDGSAEVMAAFPDAPGQLAPTSGNEPSSSTGFIYGDMQRKASRPREVRPSTTVTSFRPQPGQKHYTPRRSAGGRNQAVWKGTGMFAADATNDGVRSFDDAGSAARFFYCGKATQQDRNEGLAVRGNHHTTVKPTDLMRYLCKLVTQPNGLVLDPFCGSGSTGKAAMFEGFRFAGMDLDESHVALSRARMLWALKELVVRDPFGFGD